MKLSVRYVADRSSDVWYHFLKTNVDAKHTSVGALPVNPFRMSTANDIMSVRQPATGDFF